jgi:NADP-reducing hydrogenase subunit HndB
MPKLSIEDLQKVREKGKPLLAVRGGGARAKVTVHMGTCGIKAGARDVVKGLLQEIEGAGVSDVVVLVAPCVGRCGEEPLASVEVSDRPPVVYGRLDASRIAQIFKEHVQQGRIVTEFMVATVQR